MTPDKLKALLADPRKLAMALADKEVCPLLPVTPETVRALPIQLAPFQAMWLLGDYTGEILKSFREMYPAIVVQRFGKGPGTRYRYSKTEVCRVGKVPCDEITQRNHSPQRRGDAEKKT